MCMACLSLCVKVYVCHASVWHTSGYQRAYVAVSHFLPLCFEVRSLFLFYHCAAYFRLASQSAPGSSSVSTFDLQ